MIKRCLLIFFFLNTVNIFAQKTEPAWYQMERDHDFLEMASYLLYKVQSDSTRNEHADYLHIARAYGYLNDYEKAIFYLKKSKQVVSNESDDQFEWYYQGTLAFFERDKDKLKKCLDKLEESHTNYYKNNYLTLKSLYENFDKGYLEASRWKDQKS